jgi:hypothetical protein
MSSRDFNLWVGLSFESDSGETNTFLSRDAIVSEVYDGTLKRAHGYKWSETLTPKMTFIKDDYSDFTQEENRAILRWLTGSKNATFLDVYKDDSEVIEYCLLGNFINVSQYKMGNGRVVGYVAEFESLTPWALSPLKTVTKSITDPNDCTVTIDVSTDEPESAIYPRITIVQDNIESVVNVNHVYGEIDEWTDGTVYYYAGTGQYFWKDADGVKHTSTTNTSGFDTISVSIMNTYIDNDGNLRSTNTLVKNNVKGETVVLDGANRVVSSSRINGRVFGNDFTWSWLPLIVGQNMVSVLGNCTITIEWREPIKCGDF